MLYKFIREQVMYMKNYQIAASMALQSDTLKLKAHFILAVTTPRLYTADATEGPYALLAVKMLLFYTV